MNKLRTGLCILICFSQLYLSSQQSDHQDLDERQMQLLEEYIESLEGAEEFDYNTLFENLLYYSRNPLNLNEAAYDDLKDLLILNEIQINGLIQHRSELGPLYSLYELQSIPSFDLKTIQTILPFVTVDESGLDYFVSLGEMMSNGDHEMFVKWRRTLENQRGYERDSHGNKAYIGDPNRYYLRYRYQYEKKLRIGLTAEKDAGENWFSDPNQLGFDFYSFHFHLRDFNRNIKDIVIGDFSFSMGQGLILHNQFGVGKSSTVINIKKGGRSLKPYSSVNEINFYRGLGVSLILGSGFELTAFGSHKKIDGNPVAPDTSDTDLEFQQFSSIVEDGLHRSQSEIAKENAVAQTTGGVQLTFRKPKTQIGLNAVFERFNKEYNRQTALYNQYQFRGKQLLNSSVSYSQQMKNINFFGELAVSDNGGFAHVHGALLGLNRKVDLALLYRNYARDYHSLNSNSFGETLGTTNEKGTYVGLEIRPFHQWTVSCFADVFRHDWLRFGRDAPSHGNEYLVKINYYRKRSLDFYVQYKYENKLENSTNPNPKIDALSETRLQRLRFHFSYRVGSKWEFRNRLEYAFYSQDNKNSKGILVYQDILFNSITSPLTISGRVAFFDTDDFDSRIYAFENDLIYEYFIPFFQFRGLRSYLNVRYDLNYNLTAEFRISRTFLENRDSIGSGQDIIDGNHRTEMKAQVKVKF